MKHGEGGQAQQNLTNQNAFASVTCPLSMNVFFIAVLYIKWYMAVVRSVRDFSQHRSYLEGSVLYHC